jgi:hypothetical protein
MHSILQDFNFFLDQQPVSASPSSRLLAEPEKRKRGMRRHTPLSQLDGVSCTLFFFARSRALVACCCTGRPRKVTASPEDSTPVLETVKGVHVMQVAAEGFLLSCITPRIASCILPCDRC